MITPRYGTQTGPRLFLTHAAAAQFAARRAVAYAQRQEVVQVMTGAGAAWRVAAA